MHGEPEILSLTSTWFIRPGQESAAVPALVALAAEVRESEPDTLAYLVHAPLGGDDRLQALPPGAPDRVVFFEMYRSADAFLRHVQGPAFTRFLERHGDLFVAANGKPFTFVEFLARRAGFIRPEAFAPAAANEPENQHPSVMFEIIGRDQAKLKAFYQAVFGWTYTSGTGGFAYVKFPVERREALGGIGQADPGTPGFEPGHNFYLLVDDLDGTIARAVEAGGTKLMPPTSIDGYQFAMIKDPEANPIGLIKPF
ncbi:antibiotic biosynthesis monooxygenase [Sorangium sp. So ce388]|uniref:antibiotic biosynthesis monooxygenase n=1 Tax=Sorangium sp. So ce388 TaxID=3133309 RepID=UPI003F5CB46D